MSTACTNATQTAVTFRKICVKSLVVNHMSDYKKIL